MMSPNVTSQFLSCLGSYEPTASAHQLIWPHAHQLIPSQTFNGPMTSLHGTSGSGPHEWYLRPSRPSRPSMWGLIRSLHQLVTLQVLIQDSGWCL